VSHAFSTAPRIDGPTAHAVADQAVVEQAVHDADEVDGSLLDLGHPEVTQKLLGLLKHGGSDG
jgi:hypothetical protein